MSAFFWARPLPPEPPLVVARMREHNRLRHRADSPLLDLDGCADCRTLATIYAESFDYERRKVVAAGGAR